MPHRWGALLALLCVGLVAPLASQSPTPAPPRLTAIKAGRLIDPNTGAAASNQIILVEGERS